MTVQEYAYAKLNLTLDVLAKRADGYHDMMMVMQTVSVCDSIRISRTAESGIRTSCNFYYIPTDGRNLAARAAKVFLDRISGCRSGAARDEQPVRPTAGSPEAGGTCRGGRF